MLTEKQVIAVKKRAARSLRDIGITDPGNFRPQDMGWSALSKAAHESAKVARSQINAIDEDTSEAEARDLETAFDGCMSLYEAAKAEMDHRDAINDRSARPGGEDAMDAPTRSAPTPADRTVTNEGGRSHNGGDAETAIALRPDQRMADHLSRQGRVSDYRGLDLGSYLRSMVTGASNEVEHRALSEGTDSAGGFTVPTPLAAQMLDLLRARTVTVQAGARTVNLTSDVHDWAKVVADPTPGWRGEGDAVPESEPTFGRVRFQPRMLSVLVKANRELLEDSVNIGTELPRIIAQAMAVELDRVLLFGSGSSNEPTGLFNDSNIQEVAHNAALSSYSPLVSARTKVKTANAEPSAYIMHPRSEGDLANLTDSNNQPLMVPPALQNLPMLTTTSVPVDQGGGTDTTILTGAFQYLLIGMRSDLRIEILRERFADNMQYGYLAHLRVDTARVHSDAFAKIVGIAES
jgi:HK97 family phage major capsid protein